MDQTRARALLAGERARLQRLLQAQAGTPPAAELGDQVDHAHRRDAEETALAVDQLLGARWAALQRAEARLAAGSYGRSLVSGQPSPTSGWSRPLAEGPSRRQPPPNGGPWRRATTRSGWYRPAISSRYSPRPTAPPKREQASDHDNDQPAPEPSLGIHSQHDRDRTR